MTVILPGDVIERVDFDARIHRYQVKGRVVPSVTQVMKPLSDAVYRTVDPAVLAAKAAFGTAVHACTEYLDRDELDEESVAPEWKPYLDAYRAWRTQVQPDIKKIEWRLGSPKYAGTIDRMVEIDGDPWIVDIKTTSELHPMVGVQLAAYEALAMGALHTHRRFRRAALQLKPDGSYRFQEFKDFQDEICFSALLSIYYWSEKHHG